MNLIDTGEVSLSGFTGEICTCNTKDKYVSKQYTLMFLIRNMDKPYSVGSLLICEYI